MADPADVEEPDIRVLSIVLEPPHFLPRVEYGDDFEDYVAVQVLEVAWRMKRAELFAECGLTVEADDDD